MNTTDIVLTCIGIFFMCIPMIGMGLCFLLPSPRILRMDKKKNCCLLGKKFFWQTQYRMKILCKLSEVNEVFRKGKPFYSPYFKLCLKIKSGEDVVVFQKTAGKIGNPSDFDEQVKKINHFLNSKDGEFEIEQEQSSADYFGGVLCLFFGCFALIHMLNMLIK